MKRAIAMLAAIVCVGSANLAAADTPAASTKAETKDPFDVASYFAVLGEFGRRSEADLAMMPGASSTVMMAGVRGIGHLGDDTYLGAKPMIEFDAFFGMAGDFAMRLHLGTPLGFYSNGKLSLAAGPGINLDIPTHLDFTLGLRAFYQLAGSTQIRASYDFSIASAPFDLYHRLDASIAFGHLAVGARLERGSAGGDNDPDITSVSTLAGLNW